MGLHLLISQSRAPLHVSLEQSQEAVCAVMGQLLMYGIQLLCALCHVF